MRVISLSRALAVFGALILTAACTDTAGPGGQYPDPIVVDQPTQPNTPSVKPEEKGGKKVKVKVKPNMEPARRLDR
jgi:hypothetical protein